MSKIKELHQLKIFIYKNLLDFRESFSEIKDIEFEKKLDKSTNIDYAYISDDDLETIIMWLKKADEIFDIYLENFEDIIDKNKDYRTYSEIEKNIVMTTASIAKAIKKVCDTKMINKHDEISKKWIKSLEKLLKILKEI